jgi:ferrous iron transport protein B
VSVHEQSGPPAPFAPPDLIIQVVDATSLQSHLELALELSQLGRPIVLALNHMDEALRKGLYINVKVLEKLLGMPVVPTVALMGQGIAQLFAAAVSAAREAICPLPQPPSRHIAESLRPLTAAMNRPDIHAAFRVPHPLLLVQFAADDGFVEGELGQHFPGLLPELRALREAAGLGLPRPLAEELHADRHHRAATLVEAAMRMGAPAATGGWRYWLDELFLHPQGGLIGSLAVFAAVLFVVFEISGWIDSMTTVRLAEAFADCSRVDRRRRRPRRARRPDRPDRHRGALHDSSGHAAGDPGTGRADAPHRFCRRSRLPPDRSARRRRRALPARAGCNVPAISGAARATSGRERVIASVLISFVPCSARSAIILAIAGKYLGAGGVFGIFALTLILIAVMGRLLSRGDREPGPGQVPEIPPYAMPTGRILLAETWDRTSDILTIVTPLLVGGSVVLALLTHVGADSVINTLLTPVTVWWLGLPLALGVPLLFGVLRKELSLLMIYQALGTQEIGNLLDSVQITVLLLFLTFYIPCVSTFAVMLRTIGRRNALFSVSISVGVALLVAVVARLLLSGVRALVA